MPDGAPRSTPDAAETLFVRLAEAYRREGLVEDAVRICREGLQRFPASLRGRIVLGQCLLDQGAIGEAIAELGRVEREGHHDPEILALLCGVRLGGPRPWPVGETVATRADAPSPWDALPEQPAEPSVLILESPDDATPVERVSGAVGSDPLASATLAGLYASQGEAAKAEAMRRQLAPEAPEPPQPDAPNARMKDYLGELRRVQQIAAKLRKAQAP
jgi:hypothetical protein